MEKETDTATVSTAAGKPFVEFELTSFFWFEQEFGPRMRRHIDALREQADGFEQFLRDNPNYENMTVFEMIRDGHIKTKDQPSEETE